MISERPPWVKWYKTPAWKRLRQRVLSRQPLCKFCERQGILTEANTVDHIQPHKGNMNKFFDITNLTSLCKPCHSSIKQKMEKRGSLGCDINGFPESWQ